MALYARLKTVAAALAAAAVLAAPAGEGAASEARSGDEFMIVDCLLPPQIRQLGASVTYLAARRAVKTSARDCEIRGGEYVVNARTNIAAALKVWLPLAEAGDLEAQVTVGEIFEKGLGIPPDHEAAALWYEAAALAGSSQAAVNLGQLYEQGLGVPESKEEAAKWYRRAAGLPDIEFEVQRAPAAVEADRAELEALRSENVALREQIREREAELDALQAQLDSLRGRKEADRAALAEQQAALERLRSQLRERQDEARQSDRMAEELAARESALDMQREEMAFLQETIEAMRAESRSMREALQQSEQTDASAAAREREDLAALQLRILELSGAYDNLQSALGERQDDLAAARRELAEMQAADAERARRIEELNREIAGREQALEERNAAIARLEEQLLELEARSEEQQREIARLSTPEPVAAAGIELIEPVFPVTRGAATLTLPAGQSELLVIGRIAAPDTLAGLQVNGREPTLSGDIFRLQLPIESPEEEVIVLARRTDGSEEMLSFAVNRPAGPSRAVETADAIGLTLDPSIAFGRYHALVIGNNAYQHLPPLEMAVKDARVLGELLEREYGFEVTLLIDATRYDILSALNRLRERLTEDDNLLIYYAGHGELDRVNQRGHWLPVDAEPYSSANWISNVAITDILNAMTVRQLMVVADSCYSGALTRGALGVLEGGRSESEKLTVIRRLIEQRSRMVLTSGGLEPVLDGGGGGHSVFAKALLDALSKNVGILSGKDLHNYILPTVTTAAGEVAHRQVPEYAPIKFAGHESGDFFFVRGL